MKIINWEKKGLIFKVNNNNKWMITHSSVPTCDKINRNTLRIYFSPRDINNRSYISFVDVDIDNPKKIKYIHNKPCLAPGKIGHFDDCGVMPSCIINHNDKKLMYYTGWNTSKTVPYRNSIGLALSNDKGISFNKLFEGPILDRYRFDPYFVATPYVIIENQIWKMWYLSTTNWVEIENKLEPVYNIKYAQSHDGITWNRENITCINYKLKNEAISRPCIIKEDNKYKMWYSYRGSIEYRTKKEQSYRIGYAESIDGITWKRKDENVRIDRSFEGWDSLMIEYPFIFQYNTKKYMFYCGNGFGKSGFGYAVLKDKI